MQREGEITLETRAAGGGLALLGFGWSVEEEGGVALEGDEASLSLPPAGPGPWRIIVHGHHAARNRAERGRPVQLFWRVGLDEPFRSESVNAGEDLNLELPLGQLASGKSGTASLQIRAPDSVLLPSEGVGEPRGMGFRLRSIRFAR